MATIQRLVLSVLLALAAALASIPASAQYDPEAPCGRDQWGRPLACARPPASQNLEAACITTGRLENCVPYHKNSCEIRGFATACRLYQMGMNCYGGDPNVCNYYVTLLRANTSCQLDRNQQACAWLQQQQF
ncbi:MAG: hypothetical protein IPK81_15545 [Rhodospirillales bacterium]|nr:MAG: hypothetical protein IPK81_15545 [Rhodospirillales bacterium]